MLERIKRALGFDKSRPTEIATMPSPKRGHPVRPIFTLIKKMNSNGQIYIPVDERTADFGPTVSEGDTLSIDVFAPDYSQERTLHNRDRRERYVEVNVTTGYRITIPAEVRDDLWFEAGDRIAIHAYWRASEE